MLELITNAEHRNYLISMQNDRLASRSGVDKKLAITEHKNHLRKAAELRRIDIEKQSVGSSYYPISNLVPDELEKQLESHS